MPTLTGQNVYIASDSVNFRTGDITKANISYNSGTDKLFFSGDMTFQDPTANITGRLEVSHIEVTGAHNPWAGTDTQYGAIYLSDMDRGLLGNMGGGYARPLITNGSNKITIGSNGTSAIHDINIQPGNGAGSAMSNFNVFTSGVKRMTITRTGNIGFGGSRAENPHQAFVFDADGGRMDLLDGSLKIRYTPNNDAITITPSVGNEGRILAYDGDTSSPHPLLIAADQIRFTTSGAGSNEVMRLTSEGNVGIGTNDPAAPLHIQSSTDHSKLRVTNDNSQSWGLMVGNSGYYQGYLMIDQVGAGQRFVINDQGSVGIGTNAPAAKLHVYSAGNGEIEVERNGGALINLQAQATRGVIGTDSNHQLDLKTNGGSRMTLLTNGNVGIGSITPAYKLDVVDSNGGALARFKDSDSSHAGLLIQGDTNGGSITNASAFSKEAIYLQNSASAIRFYTDGTEAVRIDSSQRVGIGTNSVNGFTHINGRMLVESPTVPSTLAISDSGDATKNLRLGYEPTWDAGSISASDFGAGWKDIIIAPYGGAVGIGTTSAPQRLTVKGGITHTNSSNIQIVTMTNSSDHGRLIVNQSAGVTKVLLDSNGVSYFNGGNVGIGVASPSQKLEVGTNTDVSAQIGRAQVGHMGFGDHAGFSHLDQAGTSSYSLLQSSAGDTFINSASNRQIYFRDGNATIGGFNSDDDFYVDTNTLYVDASQNNVGVGTSTHPASSKLTIQADNSNDIITGLLINSYQSTTGTAGKGVGIVMGQNNGVYSSKIANVWTENNPSYLQTNIAFYTMHDSYLPGSETEKMRLTSQGRLGIGTVSPSSPLHVIGTRVRLDGGAGGFYKYTAAEAFRFALYDDGSKTKLYADGDGVNSQMCFDGGKVGIGTDSPDYTLTVDAGATNEIARFRSTDNDALISITDNTDTVYIGHDASADIMCLGFSNTVGSTTNLNIDTAGSVGIGTSNPAEKLEVAGNILAKDAGVLAGVGGDKDGFIFHDLYTAGGNYWGYKALSGPNRLAIVTNGAEVITVDSNTRVGIGTTAPTAKLEVSGSNTFRGVSAFYGSTTANKALSFQFDPSYQSVSNVLRFRQGGSTAGGVAFSLYDYVPSLFLTYSSTSPRVGIGTASPGDTLDLRGDMRLDSAGNTDRSIYFRNQSSQGKIRSDAALQFEVGVSSSPALAMHIEEETRTVGIGTNAPRSGSLHIYNTNDVSDGDGSASMNPTGQDSIVLYTQGGGGNKNFGSISWLDGGRRRAMIAAANESADGDYQGLSFFTRGTDGPGDLYESMRINHGGRVSIGVTGAADFHANAQRLVVGDGAGNEGITIYAGASSAGSLYFADGTAGDAAYRGYVQYSHSAEKLFLGAGGTTKMTITNGARVGIGTDTPSKQVEIRAAEPFLRLEESDSGGNKRLDLFVSNSTGVIATNQSAQTMMFQTVNDTRMTIRSDGKVGIGLTDPDQKLHVSDNVRIGDGGASDYNRIEFTRYGGAIVGGIGWHTDSEFYVGGHPSVGPTAGNTVRVYGFGDDVRLGDSVNGDVLTVDATNGGVGIGTIHPSTKLHVHGGAASNGEGEIRNDSRINRNYKVVLGSTTKYIGTVEMAGNGDSAGFHVRIYDGHSRVWREINVVVQNDGGTNNVKVIVEGGGNDANINIEFAYVNRSGAAQKTDFYLVPTSKAYYQIVYIDGLIKTDTGHSSTSTTNINLDTAVGIYKAATDDSSRVGIGTNNPSANLDIRNSSSWSELHLDGSNGGEIKLQKAGTTHLDIYASDAGSTASVIKSQSHLQLSSNNSTNANRSIYLKSDGNVGIGINDPSTTLEVAGPAGMGSVEIGSGIFTDYNGIRMNGSTSSVDYNFLSSSSDKTLYINRPANYDIRFREANADQVIINQHGSVGIGTNSPSHRLDVVGTYRISNNTSNNTDKLHRMLGRHYTNTELDVNIFSSISTSSTNSISFGGGSSSYNQATDIRFYTSSDNTSPWDGTSSAKERMRIDNQGRVGIGSQSPGYTLDVVGTIVGTSKSFLIDHPTQTGKKLMHACIEGPENGVYFRGKSQDSVIEAPEYWSGLVDIDSMTVDITPIGPNQSIYIDRIEDNGDVYVGANTDEPLNYFYVIYGERKDIDKLEIVKDSPSTLEDESGIHE